MTTETSVEQYRQWAENWRVAGEKLDQLERQELPRLDTQRALLHLADAFESCRLHHPPLPTSGLIEQQAIFRRLRK